MTDDQRIPCRTAEDGAAMIARWESCGFDPETDHPADVAKVCKFLGITAEHLSDIGMPEEYVAAVRDEI